MIGTVTADPTVSPRPWHHSRALHDPLRGYTFVEPSADLTPAAPRSTVAEIPPLWYRLATGRSFGWRWRRLVRVLRRRRRMMARRVIRWAQANPEIAHAARRGRPLVVARGLFSGNHRASSVPARVIDWPVSIGATLELDESSAAVLHGVTLSTACDARSTQVPALHVRVQDDLLQVETGGRTATVLAPIDVQRWSPRGWRVPSSRDVLTLTDAAAVVAELPQRQAMRFLRRVPAVQIDGGERQPPATATTVVKLLCAGVIVQGELGSEVRRLLGPGVSALVAAPLPSGTALVREQRSVRLRRAALDAFGSRGRWSEIADVVQVPSDAVPHVSVLLPSNRPSDVVFAARQVAAQTGVRVQLVVGLHGSAMPPDLDAELRRSGPEDLVVCRLPDEMTLGGVMNALTAQAAAPLVAKWDDDDWYDSEHLLDLALALEYSRASLVGKAAEFVRLEGLDLTVRRFARGSESFSTTVAGGALLARTGDVRDVGWADVPRRVDRMLIEAFAARGLETYRTHGFGYVLRRRSGGRGSHTWQADDGYFLAQATEQRRGLDLGFAGVSAGDST